MSPWRQMVMELRGLWAVKLLHYAFRMCDDRDPLKKALARFVLEHRPELGRAGVKVFARARRVA